MKPNKPHPLTVLEKEMMDFLFNATVIASTIQNCGRTASEIAKALKIDRSNASRMLNKLNREGYISKLNGRPVIFMNREAIKAKFSLNFFPTVINKTQDIENLFETSHDLLYIQEDMLLYNENFESQLNNKLREFLTTLTHSSIDNHCLIYGDPGSGKHQFLRQVIYRGIDESSIDNSFLFFELDCNFIEEALIIEEILNFTPQDEKKIVVTIRNMDILNQKNKNILFDLVSSNSIYLNNNSMTNKYLFVFITSDDRCEEFATLKELIPCQVRIPNFSEKTVKEKMVYIIFFLQKETDYIDKIIYVPYNILNCILLSTYHLNLLQLRREIRQTIIRTNLRMDKNIVLEINFEDLSDSLLEHITNPTPLEAELRKLYENFKFNNLILTPNENCETLRNLLMNDLQKVEYPISIRTNEEISLDVKNICKKIIAIAISQYVRLDPTTLRLKEFLNAISPKCLLWANDNLLNRFLLEVNALLLNRQFSNKFNIDRFSTHIDSTQDYVEKLEHFYSFTLSNYEITFIDNYLKIAYSVIKKEAIAIIIITENDYYSRIYGQIANFLNYDVYFYPYILRQGHNETYTQKALSDFLNFCQANERGRGLLLLFSGDISQQLFEKISHSKLDIEIRTNFTLKDLEIYMNEVATPTCYLEDLSQKNANEPDENEALNIKNYLQLLHDGILSDQLNFVNPKKAMKASEQLLSSIINDFNIENSEKLTIQFITHVSFMIERLRCNNPLQYKSTGKFVKERYSLIQIIEKYLETISLQFDITIPQSELVYIAKIILEYQDARQI